MPANAPGSDRHVPIDRPGLPVVTVSSDARHTRAPALLAAHEPPPATIEREAGKSPFVLICDHAGRRLPEALGDLGVPDSDLARHIAWDIGAAGLAREMARRLDAYLVTQTYSRLVIDCNRPPGSPGSIVTRSEDTDIPGNRDLTSAAADARREQIFDPYHGAIVAELDRRATLALPTLLVSVHSFTPVFSAVARPWHIGVLYHRDARVAHALLERMRQDRRWVVGDNEPYSVSDDSDYAIPIHGERRGLPHVELEVRQDLIADARGQQEWGARLAEWFSGVAREPGLLAPHAG